MFTLKRFLAFIAAGLILIAARFYPHALMSGEYGPPVFYDCADEITLDGDAYSYCRVETTGGDSKARYLIKSLGAEVLFVERPDGETIYYCFSRAFPRSITIYGRKVNLAVAVRGDAVTAMTPTLKGSY